MRKIKNLEHELTRAEQVWGPLGGAAIESLTSLICAHKLSILSGDLLYLNNRWYITHSGLLRLANRKRCAGIKVLPVRAFCDPKADRWAFKATVFRSTTCRVPKSSPFCRSTSRRCAAFPLPRACMRWISPACASRTSPSGRFGWDRSSPDAARSRSSAPIMGKSNPCAPRIATSARG